MGIYRWVSIILKHQSMSFNPNSCEALRLYSADAFYYLINLMDVKE